MKKCIKCLVEKEYSLFHKRSSSKDGYKNTCRDCVNMYGKENKKKHNKKYKDNNKEILKIKYKIYEGENKEKRKKYREDNRKILNEKRRVYQKYKMETDSLFKLKRRIRNIVYKSVKNKSKNITTERIIGCDYNNLKIYLETKFESWMTWENYGLYNGELNYGWDIDHIIPLSSTVNEDDIINLNHYTNLQPLCSYTNRHIKSNK